jgi:hypothetical protein
MANSAGRRKNIRTENVVLRKALEKAKRRSQRTSAEGAWSDAIGEEAPVPPTAGTAATETASATSGAASGIRPRPTAAGVAGTEEGVTASEGWFAKAMARGKKALKTPQGKLGAAAMVALLVAEAAKNSALGLATDVIQTGQQSRSLDVQGELAPQLAQQEAMQPITQSQKQAALYLLMQQLGARGKPMLADGESLT